MAIDEIQVRAKRIEGLPAGSQFGLGAFGLGTGTGGGRQGPSEPATPAGPRKRPPVPSDEAPIEEIIVTAAATPLFKGIPRAFWPLPTSQAIAAAKGRAGIAIGTTAKAMEEIIVRGKRSGALKTATRASRLNVAGLLAFLGGALVAEILREVSQGRLEESFRELMKDPEPKPDTPVSTIPETIPEIIVRGVQPDPILRPIFVATPFQAMSPRRFARDTFPEIPQEKPVVPPENVGEIQPPPKPAKPKRKPKLPAGLVGGAFLLGSFGRSERPTPQGRSRRLGIGRPKTIPFSDPLTPTLTGFDPSVLPSASAPTRAGFCPPCKPRSKKKKRTKCYRKLVKEGRYASRDKIYKWVRIDCDTGRELRSK